MKFLIISCLLAAAYAKPGALIAPLAYSNHFAYASPYFTTHLATPLAYTAPVITAAAPLIEKTQYHAQDTLGQASYGHTEPLQAHHATQDAAGNKVGSYSYVAPDGQIFSTSYIADALGYRANSNALPLAPAAVPIAPQETAEVTAARIAHLNEHALVKSRSRRSVAVVAAPAALTYQTPVLNRYAYAAPVYRTAALAVAHAPAYSYVY